MSTLSHQATMAFGDTDLLSSGHDEIMLWLNGWVRSPAGIAILFKNKIPVDAKAVVQWELPIHTQYKKCVGFVDLQVKYYYGDYSAVSYRYDDGELRCFHQLSDDRTSLWRAHFEVKSRIDSCGSLLRQLRTYSALGVSNLWVVAPRNDEIAIVIREQGYGWIDAFTRSTETT